MVKILIPRNAFGVVRIEMLEDRLILVRTYTPPFEDIVCKISQLPKKLRSFINLRMKAGDIEYVEDL